MSSDFDFYLASASPRRRELLEQIGCRFALLSVVSNEEALESETPRQLACRLAMEKAAAGWRHLASASRKPVLGADTVVVVDRQVLGKPRDEADAARMLLALSAREHCVITAVAVLGEHGGDTQCSESRVRMRAIGREEIRRYWASGECRDKAGSYAIQGLGAIFVERIEGSYSGVVGLPLYETALLLQRFGIRCWRTGGLDR